MTDEELMRAALDEAKIAADLGEVPVGAVVAKDGEIRVVAVLDAQPRKADGIPVARRGPRKRQKRVVEQEAVRRRAVVRLFPRHDAVGNRPHVGGVGGPSMRGQEGGQAEQPEQQA